MAEAHQAIGVFQEHKRGVELLYGEEGIRITFTIPPAWEIRQNVVRQYFHIKRAILRRVYPAPPLVAILTVTYVVVMVQISPSESWWRNGMISHLVWNIGNFITPSWAAAYLPKSVYLASLAAWTSFILFLFLMSLQRMVLRLLLSFRLWLYQNPGQRSNIVTIWGALVKLLNGSNPLTYSFQDALPRLPVPAVEDTIERYLASVHPLLSEKEFQAEKQMAESFLVNEAPKLQFYLRLKSWWSSNYVTDWWEQYVYLKGRGSIMINSNYYGLPARDFNFRLSSNQLAVAAVFIRHFMLFKQMLDREQLPPLMLQGIVPLCMSQYRRMFGCTRIPGREQDRLQEYYHLAKHVVVLCKGYFFTLPLFEKGRHGKLLSFHELQRQLEWIQSTATQQQEQSIPTLDVAALTSTGRIEWAENRERYFSQGQNKLSLSAIESAAFVVVLQDNAPEDWSAMGKDLIHGDGTTRWFDKSFTLVIYSNGLTGFNAEHAWADAPVMAHVWEYVQTMQTIAYAYDENGNTKIENTSQVESALPQCKLLQWTSSVGLDKAIISAKNQSKEAIANFDLKVIAHDDYGKGLMKKFRVSPDAFVQMALQLAYYWNSKGNFTQTYEASMTRLYQDGRTETVRPVTDESKAFVLAMVSDTHTKEQKKKLLQDACNQHQQLYRNAMSGKGLDRHLFTLYCVSIGFNMESSFLSSALSRPWRLSTSQQPQQQTYNWPLVEKYLTEHTNYSLQDVFSPGGGFGPVANDGYGVSYMIVGEQNVFFHISSKKDCPSTSSEAFANDIFRAFAAMKALQ